MFEKIHILLSWLISINYTLENNFITDFNRIEFIQSNLAYKYAVPTLTTYLENSQHRWFAIFYYAHLGKLEQDRFFLVPKFYSLDTTCHGEEELIVLVKTEDNQGMPVVRKSLIYMNPYNIFLNSQWGKKTMKL